MKKIIATAIFMYSSFANAQECYKSTIQSPSPFLGNHGEIVKLSNGTIWEIQHEYEYMYEYYPSVIACPSRGILLVGDKRLSARAIKSESKANTATVIESSIISKFNGLNMGNIYRLSNGQIWEQTEAWVWTWVWIQPKVMIYSQKGLTKMKVENIDHAVTIRRIK